MNLTRALGDLKHKEKEGLTPEEQPITANPDVYEYELTEDIDFIFLGCDGVWEQMDNDEMVAWIYERLGKDKTEADLNKITEELLQSQLSHDVQATEGKGCDNMSCILVVLKK